jgi:peptidoglycan-N-acetylglucosamine deacetylase
MNDANIENADSRKVVVTTSWDDGHLLDFKLGEILNKHGIKGTLYVALGNRERMSMNPTRLKEISEMFEIGGHTRTHTPLSGLSPERMKDEIAGCKKDLEDLLGKEIQMFCYPRGIYNDLARKTVIEAGYIGGRTTRQFLTTAGTDRFLMPTSMHAFPYTALMRCRHCMKNSNYKGLAKILKYGIGKRWHELGARLFEEAVANNGVWHLWGHSWELETHSIWDDLNELLEMIGNRDNVKHMTNGEFAASTNWATG